MCVYVRTDTSRHLYINIHRVMQLAFFLSRLSRTIFRRNCVYASVRYANDEFPTALFGSAFYNVRAPSTVFAFSLSLFRSHVIANKIFNQAFFYCVKKLENIVNWQGFHSEKNQPRFHEGWVEFRTSHYCRKGLGLPA